jgi:arylsulfatase A-like enzyme
MTIGTPVRSVSLAVALVASACGGRSTDPDPAAIRLVDAFTEASVSGTPDAAARPIPRTEWRFDAAAAGGHDAWQAGAGVAGLATKDGLLSGRTTDAFAAVYVKRASDLDNPDLVHAIEVRMRASAGGKMVVAPAGDKVDFEEMKKAAADPSQLAADLTPGTELQTYTITPPLPLAGSAFKHLVLRPSDAAGASFDIESVRLVFRREHLASIPSGVTWQGLKAIYRESLAARAPETITITVTVPERGWLDLGIGTIEDAPVTFTLAAKAGASGPVSLLERTVTTPHRWEQVPVDLAQFAGRDVALSLSLGADDPGTIGFWGSPVVRSRAASPRAPSGASGAAGARPRGVIVIQADTLRRDHLDLYGYGRKTAPQLTRLAGEGTTFTNYTVQGTWTKVSTPSLMTSLYPLTHGVHDFYDRLPAAAHTMAESFRNAGYATVSYSSVIFAGQFTNLHKGFEEVHEDGSLTGQGSSKTAREYIDRLSAWLEQHHDTPFFAFLNVFDPHDPYQPARPYDTLWADPARKDEHEKQVAAVKTIITDPLRKQFGMPTRQELVKAGFDPDKYVQYDRDWYDGSIRGLDVEVARLVQKLRTLGVDQDTLLVFLSDHGEEFLEHGQMFHGQTVYGELTQVPLVVRWPAGVASGRVVDEVVQSIDVMPTLLELSGIASPEGIQGQSLVPLVRAGADPSAWVPRPAITEKAKTSGGFAPPPHDTESYAIVDAGWKLVHNVARPDGTPEFELYDFAKDPLNTRDVAAQHPEVVARLAKALQGWRAMATAARLKPDSETTRSLSPEQLQRLKSLGYVR